MTAEAAARAGTADLPRRVPSGIAPLDSHLEGLSPGGLYLLGGGEVDVRHYLSLVFLRAGVRSGDSGTLVTQAPRDQLLRRLEQWELGELTEAWKEGRLRISGYRGGYEHRVRNAGDPGTVFEELERRVDPDADRVALVPGRPLWEGALGPVMTEAFIEWTLRTPATVWSTSQGAVDESPDDERLHHVANGIFQLTEDARGRASIRVRKTTAADLETTTLPLDDTFGEIAGGRRAGSSPRVLVMAPPESEGAGSSFSTIRGWLGEVGEAREVADPMDLLDALRDAAGVDLVVVFAAQDDLDSSVRACRLASSVARTPVVAVVEDRVRARDRAHLIRAGADECLSGPVNLGELATRLDRLLPGRGGFAAMGGEGSTAHSGDRDGTQAGGVVAEEEFRSLLRRRLSRQPPEVFTVVRLPGGVLPEEAERRLSEVIRLEDGDVVGPVDGGLAVYLAGTSPDEAEGFLNRLASSYGEVREEAELLGSMRDAGPLRRLAGDG